MNCKDLPVVAYFVWFDAGSSKEDPCGIMTLNAADVVCLRYELSRMAMLLKRLNHECEFVYHNEWELPEVEDLAERMMSGKRAYLKIPHIAQNVQPRLN